MEASRSLSSRFFQGKKNVFFSVVKTEKIVTKAESLPRGMADGASGWSEAKRNVSTNMIMLRHININISCMEKMKNIIQMRIRSSGSSTFLESEFE
jgi:hypothetical protein